MSYEEYLPSDVINLTHGSDNANLNEPGSITKGGKWGSFLFFVIDEETGPYKHKVNYKTSVAYEELAELRDIRWNINYGGDDEYTEDGRKVVALYAKMWGISVEDALDTITDYKFNSDVWTQEAWEDAYVDIQRAAGEVASALGFRGAFLEDDNGRVVILNMLGRETELFPATDDNWY